MVSDDKAQRDYPAYLLERIRELAVAKQVAYRGQRVQQDVANLGYAFEGVCECISQLREEHFSHSEKPHGDKLWQDVYCCRWAVGPSPPSVDELYIKLLLGNSALYVTLCSFHLHR